MPFSHSLSDNPSSKGNLYEDRTFADDADLQRMLQIIKPGSIGDVWWQRDCTGDGVTIQLVTGVKPSKEFILRPMNSVDRQVITEDGGTYECRRFPSNARKLQMLKVRPPIELKGFTCNAWWIEDYPTDYKGTRTLRTGLRVDKSVQVVSGDGLDAMTKRQLLTQAGLLNIKDLSEEMTEGEIIARIRAVKSAKSEKKSKQLQAV